MAKTTYKYRKQSSVRDPRSILPVVLKLSAVSVVALSVVAYFVYLAITK